MNQPNLMEFEKEEDAAILLSAIRNVEMSEDGPVNFRSVDENMGKLCKKHLTNSLNSQVYTQDIKTTVRCVGCPVWGLNGVGGCRFNNAYTNAILRKEVLKNPVWYEELPFFDKERLVTVFDDRNKVVNMWRSLGVSCFQVADGNF